MPSKLIVLVSLLIMTALPIIGQPTRCDGAEANAEVYSSIHYTVPFQTGVEVNAAPINCIQPIKAIKGQKFVLFEVKELYLESTALCITYVEDNPDFCASSYLVQLIGPSGTFQVNSTTLGINQAPSSWASEPADDGILRYKITSELIDVSACTIDSDCYLSLRVLMSGPPGAQRVQGLDLGVSSFDFKLSHSNFAYYYWPEDSRDSLARSRTSRPKLCFGCPEESINGSHIQVSAAVSGGWGIAPPIKAEITFELANPVGVLGYRRGTSSNYGYGVGSTESDPDFKFTQEKNGSLAPPTVDGQSIKTIGEVEQSAVTVTSFDYGGVTLVRAKAQFNGVWHYADSTDIVEDDEFNLLPKAACAVDAGDSRGFLQIPIDVDCNWIADGWEKPKAKRALASGTSPGTTIHFPQYWDEETALPSTPSNLRKGDGFGAYDEYRGFHTTKDDNNNSIQFERTDASILDSFYVGHQEPPEHIGSMKAAVKEILEKELPPKTNGNGEVLRDEYDDPLLSVKLHSLKSGLYQFDPISSEASALNINTELLSNPFNYPILLSPKTCPADERALGFTPGSGKAPGEITLCLNNIYNGLGNDQAWKRSVLAQVVVTCSP
jgi:hypothetical protein